MEGIATADLAALLTWREKASWRVLTHIVAPAKLQRAAETGRLEATTSAARRTLPKASLIGLVRTLRNWIAHLQPRGATEAGWATYATSHTYRAEEASAKRRFVSEFTAAYRPGLVLDLGCNTGDYAAACLEAGARAVIGLEADPATADKAFRRAAAERLNFLPLVMDAADPSPARGWREAERRGLSQRASFDALIALAFEHHLAIARNVPLDQLIAWVTGLAPRGVIEFVQKDDPTVQRMLALREDIFDDYSESRFTTLLARHARIVRQETVSATGRVLFWYERDRA
jgi:SAM-dependent methyltransferase